MVWRVAAAAAAALAVVVWTDRGASEAGTGAAVIRITGDERRFERVDVGRRGQSPGDTELYIHGLFNRRITSRPIGHSEFVCTVALNGARSCRMTFFLPRGKLVAGGSLRFGGIYQIPILGGTGLYDNARGTLTGTRLGPRRYLLYFRLVG